MTRPGSVGLVLEVALDDPVVVRSDHEGSLGAVHGDARRLRRRQAERVGTDETPLVEVADPHGLEIHDAKRAVVAAGDEEPAVMPGYAQGMLETRVGEGVVAGAEIVKPGAGQGVAPPPLPRVVERQAAPP